MIVQIPAEGILKTNDWGDSKVYKVACECSQPNHDHNVWIEADDVSVTVTVYTTESSNFWSKNRWNAIWTLLTKGYVETESSLILRKQQAYNYAHTLLSAIDDVEKFRSQRQAMGNLQNKIASKLAKEGDCE